MGLLVAILKEGESRRGGKSRWLPLSCRKATALEQSFPILVHLLLKPGNDVAVFRAQQVGEPALGLEPIDYWPLHFRHYGEPPLALFHLIERPHTGFGGQPG